MTNNEALNDNDTWTRISLAALRVLAQIEKTEENIARENHEARDEENKSEHDGQRDTCDPVVISERKRSA